MSDELLDQFLLEGRELLHTATADLLALERAPGDAAALQRLFRAVHTLKGSTGLFALPAMGRLLHAAEDALGRVRDVGTTGGTTGRATGLDRALSDALLGCLGACETWLDAIAATGTLPGDADEAAAALLRRLGDAQTATAPEAAAGAAAESGPDAPPPGWLAALLRRFAPEIERAGSGGRPLQAIRFAPAPDCFFLGDDPMALLPRIPEPVALHLEPLLPWTPDAFDPFRCNLLLFALSTAPAAALRAPFRLAAGTLEVAEVPAAAPVPAAAAPAAAATGARQLRVDAARIDAMVALGGELLLAQNGLGALLRQAAALDPGFGRALAASHAEIERLGGLLRRTATGLRLAPLSRLFRRLPRLVREIAEGEGKRVELLVEGEDALLDGAIADALLEPLLHVLRNAVGHGIEPAAQRLAAGKPGAGRILVAATERSDALLLLVRDDGAGIDPERVRAAARARGLLDEPALAALDPAGCLELVFLPGFSTARSVTELSGRGVGMDAVRAALSAVGGQVSIESEPGAGCCVRMALPRTVSGTTVLAVRAGDGRFGLPMGGVREIARLRPEQAVPVGRGEAMTLRGRVLPLLRLARLLGQEEAGADGNRRVVVFEGRDGPVGVVVDVVEGRLDVLVRPPDGLLRGLRGLAGTALPGDGGVLMVLELEALIP